MVRVRINAELISDWESFHDVFSKTFGFPSFYGRNLDAWLDCMSYIDDKESGMTKICIGSKDTLIIELTNSEKLKTKNLEIFSKLLECCALVNSRILESNGQCSIAVALG